MTEQAKRPNNTEIAKLYRDFIIAHPEAHKEQYMPLRSLGIDVFDAAWEVLLQNNAAGKEWEINPTDAGAEEYEEIMKAQEIVL